MKKILIAIMATMTIAISADAMSYEQARREALFLTDKMAYELNLSQEQYDAAYEINLDYLMGVTSVDDVYSDYWTRRNLDLSYILLDWQWNAFRAATYFYRPLYWDGGYWHFGIYARYPRRTFFYFDRPTIYVSYRGGHSWRANGGQSFYHGRRDDFMRGGDNHYGMRDRWDNGSFRGNRNNGRGSSTRITVNNDHNNASSNNRNYGQSTGTTANRNNFGTARSGGSFSGRRTTSSSSSTQHNSSASKRSGAVSTQRSGSFSTQRSSSTTKHSGSFSSSRGSSPAPKGNTNSRGGFSGRR